MLPTDRTTVIFESQRVQIRAYGCDVACRPQPTDKCARWSAVLVMRAGRFFRRMGKDTFLVDQQKAMLYNAEQSYEVWHPDDRGDAITEFVLDSDLLSEISAGVDRANADPESTPFRQPGAYISSRQCMLHHSIWRAAQAEDPEPINIEEPVIQFVAQVIGQSLDQTGDAVSSSRVSTLRAHRALALDASLLLNTHFHERLSLDDLAEALDVSPWHLCRVMRAQSGMTVLRYLTRVRLRASLQRLMDPADPIAHIARDVGFSDQSHYTNAFSREFGISPARARRNSGSSMLRELSKILQDLPRSA